MESTPTRLRFITRHEPTAEQAELVKRLGYFGLERIALDFSRNPVSDLRSVGITAPAEIAVVAPAHIVIGLVRAGFSIIEFENTQDSRAKKQFVCSGMYRITNDGMQFYSSTDDAS